MARTLILPLLAGLIAASPQDKIDARKWAEAVGYFQKHSNARDPYERARSADELGAATTDKTDKLCWQLLTALLRAELAREGTNGKNEEKVIGDVLEACLNAMRKIANKDAIAEMTKTAKAKAENVRVRAFAIWALDKNGDLKDLSELVEDKNPVIQIAATDSLAERGDKASTPLFLKLLSEPRTWEVKLMALKGLEKSADEAAVDTLIESLGKCKGDEGRLKDQYIKVLKKLTALELDHDDPNAWKAAWVAKKAGSDLPAGTTVVQPTEFYGLKTRSTRLVFVLDRTGSMEAPGSEPTRSIYKLPPDAVGGGKEPPQETTAREEATRIKKKWDDKKPQTRMDVAKKEFITTVYVLSPKVHFNVVWYEGTPSAWKQELVPATWVNKLDCLKETDKLGPSGSTNIWDALELAFRMIEQPMRPDVFVIDKKTNYATAIAGADTFYLMTDGRPNAGRVDKPDGILTELRKVNRLRKVVINAICVGDPPPGGDPMDGPDPVFLKKIADENGGEFVHIRK